MATQRHGAMKWPARMVNLPRTRLGGAAGAHKWEMSDKEIINEESRLQNMPVTPNNPASKDTQNDLKRSLKIISASALSFFVSVAACVATLVAIIHVHKKVMGDEDTMGVTGIVFSVLVLLLPWIVPWFAVVFGKRFIRNTAIVTGVGLLIYGSITFWALSRGWTYTAAVADRANYKVHVVEGPYGESSSHKEKLIKAGFSASDRFEDADVFATNYRGSLALFKKDNGWIYGTVWVSELFLQRDASGTASVVRHPVTGESTFRPLHKETIQPHSFVYVEDKSQIRKAVVDFESSLRKAGLGLTVLRSKADYVVEIGDANQETDDERQLSYKSTILVHPIQQKKPPVSISCIGEGGKIPDITVTTIRIRIPSGGISASTTGGPHNRAREAWEKDVDSKLKSDVMKLLRRR